MLRATTKWVATTPVVGTGKSDRRISYPRRRRLEVARSSPRERAGGSSPDCVKGWGIGRRYRVCGTPQSRARLPHLLPSCEGMRPRQMRHPPASDEHRQSFQARSSRSHPWESSTRLAHRRGTRCSAPAEAFRAPGQILATARKPEGFELRLRLTASFLSSEVSSECEGIPARSRRALWRHYGS